jgi:hypothetical protein
MILSLSPVIIYLPRLQYSTHSPYLLTYLLRDSRPIIHLIILITNHLTHIFLTTLMSSLHHGSMRNNNSGNSSDEQQQPVLSFFIQTFFHFVFISFFHFPKHINSKHQTTATAAAGVSRRGWSWD